MANEGFVGIAADQSGKKVDTTELTRADGTVIERQRVAVSDDSNPSTGSVAEVRDRKLQVSSPEIRLLISIDDSLQQILMLMQAALK